MLKTRDEAVDYLMGCINYERQQPPRHQEPGFKLSTMRELARRLNNPQSAYPVIHIAGTKGKGSTAAMIAAMLRQSGRRVGLYTSPHIHRIEERLVIDAQPIGAEEFVAIVNELKPVADQLGDDIRRGRFEGSPPTFFELITMAAWLHFRRAQVEWAVVEVGLGGRLDSTNICEPQIGVITSISLDHTQQLGGTLTAIAAEKAGIIKPGMQVVSGVKGQPADVIRHRCQSQAADLMQLDIDFAAVPSLGPVPRACFEGTPMGRAQDPGCEVRGNDDFFDFESRHPRLISAVGFDRIAELSVPLPGAHQWQNASLAVAAVLLCQEFGWPVSSNEVREGLTSAHLPGRIEVLPGQRRIVVDVAHNQAAIEALCTTLNTALSQATRSTAVLSISDDKDAREMLRPLLQHFDTLLVTAYQENPRAMSVERLAEVARGLCPSENLGGRVLHIEAVETPRAAMDWLRQHEAPGELVCVTGSTFLVAELRPSLLQWSLEQVGFGPTFLAPSV